MKRVDHTSCLLWSCTDMSHTVKEIFKQCLGLGARYISVENIVLWQRATPGATLMNKCMMGLQGNEEQNGTLHRMLQLIEEQVLVRSGWQIYFFICLFCYSLFSLFPFLSNFYHVLIYFSFASGSETTGVESRYGNIGK